MTGSYLRSEILSFWEVTEEQQAGQISDYGKELAEESMYVQNPCNEAEILPLHMFVRTEHTKVWNGIYGLSAFGAYFIKISRCGTGAVVAYRYF